MVTTFPQLHHDVNHLDVEFCLLRSLFSGFSCWPVKMIDKRVFFHIEICGLCNVSIIVQVCK